MRDPSQLETRPPFPVGRILRGIVWTVGGIVWTILSMGVAWVWAAIVTLGHAHARYCAELMTDEGTCWPTAAQDLAANVELWAWRIGVLVVFTTPVWLSLVVWARQRSRGTRPPSPQRP